MAGYAATKTAAASEQDVTELSINTIRGLAMDSVQKANAGHPGTAMALAPLAYTIFRRFLRANPQNPHWRDRDRFVLSNGHACVLQYALLHLTGYDLGIEDLKQFRQWDSRTPGHPERGLTPGIEVTTGPLGQGISNAVGLAMAERFLAERYNRPGAEIVDHHTYVICGDGDLMEGVSQEASSIAGHFGLGKLIVCYDDNHITIDGSTSISFDTENHMARYAANGWHVQRVSDVEDLDALYDAIDEAREETERPSFIAIRSHIGYPAPHAVDTAKAHGAPLGEPEVRAAKEVMGFDPDQHFWVDDSVMEHMSLREDGAAYEQEWQARFDEWARAHPEMAEDWERAWRGELVDGWEEGLATFEAGTSIATRSAGQKVMQSFSRYAPTMVGGAADLVESTKTVFEGGGEYSDVHVGRNVPFGIREHGMGAIVNGLGAHGGIVKPYGSTFLQFSDYMRGALRLSAVMELPVLWVYTHDSVALGEDGPTHQPVEHLTALRVIPHMWVIRPGDANETTEAWRVALKRSDGPVAIMLSRQNVEVLDRSEVAPAAGLAQGGYVLWDAPGGDPEVILISTGAEVPMTLAAGRSLAEAGTRARVVSMPCVELFELQSQEYRDGVLPPGVRARLAVEPGSPVSWWKWVGDAGDVLGIDRFGASAPGAKVLEEFGFTAENVAARAKAVLERVS
jgi:transketolase